jgi:outer membrane protein assembly factor BamB
VNKFLIFFLIFIVNCSLDTRSGIWTEQKKVKQDKILNVIFEDNKIFEKELNVKLIIKLDSKVVTNSYINNYTNNSGRVNFNGNLKNISKFNFSKIDNFNYFEPKLVFQNDNLIFFDDKGSIIKFDKFSKIIWKKNFYSKSEKKLKPILNFDNNNDTLIVTDNISKYYAININTGELLWEKYNSAPFNSQIKIYKDKFYVIDFDNVLKCFSIKDGQELWKFSTGNTFLKSEKRHSLIVVDNGVYFNNSLGDITGLNIQNGHLLWQTPTQSTSIAEEAFNLKTSDIVADKDSIVFSNNKNEFYSLNLKTGKLKWKQKINSNVRPTIINNLIFSVSNEGYLFIINSKSGNIVRITDIFQSFKKKKRNKINPEGFIVGKEKIYLTTNNGKLLIIDIASGKTVSILKIDNEKISQPFVSNKNLFIIKENSIIKLN